MILTDPFSATSVHSVANRAAYVLFDCNQLGITRARDKRGQTYPQVQSVRLLFQFLVLLPRRPTHHAGIGADAHQPPTSVWQSRSRSAVDSVDGVPMATRP